MDTEMYQDTQAMIMNIGRMVRLIPLAEFIQQAEHADTIGPFIDPTLWMKGHENLSKILKLARALQEFQAIVVGMVERGAPTP